MSEAQPKEPSDEPAHDDPSSDVAETQAPAHLEERGIDERLEKALDETQWPDADE